MKSYLGDGVYIEATAIGRIKLTTENGLSVTNTIYLEPEVLAAFWSFIERIRHGRVELDPEQVGSRST